MCDMDHSDRAVIGQPAQQDQVKPLALIAQVGLSSRSAGSCATSTLLDARMNAIAFGAPELTGGE